MTLTALARSTAVAEDGRVELEAVTARFGDTVAIDDLSLDISPGEFLVMLGPSGCGKTTVLRIIAGLEEPATGSVFIGGRPVADLDPKDRDVAMVFQSYALYPHLTVADNIAFPLRKRKVPRAERRALIAEVAALIGLSHLLDRRPGQLSGGERQRVALARAIVRQPQVFLMDEPLSNLDGPLRTEARTELAYLQQRLGSTFVFVTHDQVEAMTMGSRVAVLDHGRLQQLGPPDDVYRRPANSFVARFVGSPGMNLIEGEVERDRQSPHVRVATGTVPLPFDAPSDLGGRVVVGVRPEHVRLGPGPLRAVVRSVESHGHDRVLRCDAGGPGDLCVRIEAAVTPPPVGAAIELAVEPSDVHLFDAGDGRRLGEVVQ